MLERGRKLIKDILVNGKKYNREIIKTHFVTPNESYVALVEIYVLPKYESGDILIMSEKIISICQNNIIYKKDMHLSFWAKTLSKFVHVTPAGEAVGNPYKMQYAIDTAGLPRILFAAGCGAIGKLLHKKGWFYVVAGQNIAGIDGFTAEAFDEYGEMGIPLPKEPEKVCQEIEDCTDIPCVLVDANYLGVEILAKSKGVKKENTFLRDVIKDNPAGQGNECTPFILVKNDN